MPEWPWEWDCPGCIFEAIDFIKLTLTHWDRSGVVQAARSNLRGAVFVYNVNTGALFEPQGRAVIRAVGPL